MKMLENSLVSAEKFCRQDLCCPDFPPGASSSGLCRATVTHVHCFALRQGQN